MGNKGILMETKTTLWYDSVGNRFFLIPDDAKLEVGRFTLETLDGNTLKVNSYAILPYEIKDDKAKQLLQASWRQIATRKVNRIVQEAVRAGQFNTDDDIAATLEQVLNPTRKQLGSKPDKYLDELYNLLHGFADLLEAEANPNPQSVKLAEQHLKALRATGIDLGVDFGDHLDGIFSRLGKNTDETTKKKLASLVTILRDTASDLAIPASDMNLDAVVEHMEADLNAALGIKDNHDTQQTDRRREYKKHADNAIARSLRNFGFEVDDK